MKEAREKILNIISHQGNATQNSWVPTHTHEKGCHQRVTGVSEGVEKLATHGLWEGAVLQPLWKTAKHRLQCDPGILLLGLYPFLGSNITADGDCSHAITRCLLPGRKVTTNPDSILKGRDITLPTKVRLVKAMVFPVVIYGCERWTIKKAEH